MACQTCACVVLSTSFKTAENSIRNKEASTGIRQPTFNESEKYSTGCLVITHAKTPLSFLWTLAYLCTNPLWNCNYLLLWKPHTAPGEYTASILTFKKLHRYSKNITSFLYNQFPCFVVISMFLDITSCKPNKIPLCPNGSIAIHPLTFSFICMTVLPACIFVYYMSAQCQESPKESVRYSRTVVRGSCELLGTSLIQEQWVLLNWVISPDVIFWQSYLQSL